MLRNDLLPLIGPFPLNISGLNGTESTYPCVPSHSLFSHTPSPLWAGTEDGWCLYFLIFCAVWMNVDKQEKSSRPKISLNTVSGRHPCEVLTWDCTCMGLVSYQQITQHLAKSPHIWHLVWGWKQPKDTWILPKGLEFSCFQVWLGPESAGWPWLIKFTALHLVPTWGPTGVMLATFIQHFAVPWGQAQSQTEYCCVEQHRVDVTTESQAKAYWHTWDCNELTLVSFGSDAQSCKIFLTL